MYKIIQTQQELEILNDKICWDDSDIVSVHIGTNKQHYFPETNRINQAGKHYHFLYSICSLEHEYLEIIFTYSEKDIDSL